MWACVMQVAVRIFQRLLQRLNKMVSSNLHINFLRNRPQDEYGPRCIEGSSGQEVIPIY